MLRFSAVTFAVLFSMAAFCGAEEKGNPDCVLFRKDYGEKLKQSKSGVRLWRTSSGWKVDQDRSVPGGRADAVEISAAKNEAEAAQLVVNAKKGLKGFTAEAGELRAPNGKVIPAGDVDVLRVRYVFTERITDSTGAKAWWPDPLPPFKGPIDIEAKKNQPLWIRVHVPADAAAGTYEGSIRLKADGYEANVPLRVKVFDFALPDRMTCTSAFGFGAGNVFEYQKISDPEQKRAVIAKYYESFRDHHISPYDPAPFSNTNVTWRKLGPDEGADLPPAERKLKQEQELTPVFDWAADAEIQHSFDTYHFNTMRLGIPGVGGATPENKLDPGYLKFKGYCQTLQQHLREKGWLDEAFLYWVDEPMPKDYPGVLEGFLKIKDVAPDINRMLTEQPEPGLIGGPNIWCPMPCTFKFEDTEARRAAGDKMWWYVCTIPKKPYVTEFIDHAGTELRVWLWQTWKYNIEGILIWQSNLWTTDCAYPDTLQDPYKDPMSWIHGYGTKKGDKKPWGNGDGRFMYPPEGATGYQKETILDGPVDSIRWEMLRDGLEDYEYLVILRNALKAHGDKLGADERKRLEALLEVPANITTDLKHFTQDPAPIEAHRALVADAIEKLSR